MHEEYRPDYNWEEYLEKEVKPSIPWEKPAEDDEENPSPYGNSEGRA